MLNWCTHFSCCISGGGEGWDFSCRGMGSGLSSSHSSPDLQLNSFIKKGMDVNMILWLFLITCIKDRHKLPILMLLFLLVTFLRVFETLTLHLVFVTWFLFLFFFVTFTFMFLLFLLGFLVTIWIFMLNVFIVDCFTMCGLRPITMKFMLMYSGEIKLSIWIDTLKNFHTLEEDEWSLHVHFWCDVSFSSSFSFFLFQQTSRQVWWMH